MDDARRDDVDPTRISVAGAYDYVVGGTDNTLAEREAAAHFSRKWPGVAETAIYNARFEERAVRWFARQGIRQILDLGAGKPKPPPRLNVHEVLAEVTDTGRVVYVERDPAAHAHARAMWGSGSGTAYIEADIQDATRVLGEVRDRNLLDLDEPVGLLLLAVLHYIDTDPAAVVAPYAEAVPAGSAVAVTHMATEGAPPELLDDLRAVWAPAGGAYIRTSAEIKAAFQGWPLAEPGLVPVQDWRPEEPAERGPLQLLGGVARKP